MQRPTNNQAGILGVSLVAAFLCFLIFFRLIGGQGFFWAVISSLIAGVLVALVIYLFLMTDHGNRLVDSGSKKVIAAASELGTKVSANLKEIDLNGPEGVATRVRESGSKIAAQLTKSPATDQPEASDTPPVEEPSKPKATASPSDESADDLKKIKGIGPKLEEKLHELGYFHFHQIAAWDDAKVAWIDENMPGFKGCASRDNWVEQAQQLASKS